MALLVQAALVQMTLGQAALARLGQALAHRKVPLIQVEAVVQKKGANLFDKYRSLTSTDDD